MRAASSKHPFTFGLAVGVPALACASALACAGCIVTTHDDTPPPLAVAVGGTLTVDWSIDGRKDSDVCAQSAVDRIQITVFVGGGGSAGTFEQSCEAFATSIPLAQGSYSASAVLLDVRGAARTTAVPINPFVIRGNDNLDTPIDFPSDSFY